jgi:hypothetical protein
VRYTLTMKDSIKLLSLFLLLLALSSCSKDIKKGDLAFLEGDYEWTFTETCYSDYIASSSNPDKFGLRITKKNKVIFFKNGQEQEKYKITRLTSIGDYSYFQFETGNTDSDKESVYYNGDTLIVGYYPFQPGCEDHDDGDNYFVKIK